MNGGGKEVYNDKNGGMTHMIKNSRKSTIIYGWDCWCLINFIIGILLVGVIKYMPVISRIVKILPKGLS